MAAPDGCVPQGQVTPDTPSPVPAKVYTLSQLSWRGRSVCMRRASAGPWWLSGVFVPFVMTLCPSFVGGGTVFVRDV